LSPATIIASVMAENMLKNSLRKVESDNNKILYETLLDFFLRRNGTYFLNKPRRYDFAVNKYLRTVASSWILLNFFYVIVYRSRNQILCIKTK